MSVPSASRGPAGPSRSVRESAQQDKPARRRPNPLQDGGSEPGKPTPRRGEPKRSQSKTKQQRIVPPWVLAGKPVKSGPRLLAWYLYVQLWLYKFDWIPQPRPHGLYLKRTNDKVADIRSLRKHTMAIVIVLTTKGGATKTTVSTWLAATLMWINKLAVVLFDTDIGGGKAAKRYGLDPSATFESRKAIELIAHDDWDPDYTDLVDQLEGDTETGVMVFHCADTKRSTSQESIMKALPALKQTCHTLVVDTPPGFGNSITEGAAQISDVACIVGRDHSEEELDDIGKTFAHEPYMFSDMKDRVLIVISGVRWSNFGTRTQYRYAERFGVEPEQVVLMPYVRHLFKTRMVNMNKLNPKALFAQVTLAEAVARAAQKYNQANPPTQPGSLRLNGLTSMETSLDT